MRAYDLTVTGSLIVSGSTTLTGDISYDDVTATGNIETTGANKVISGSVTSTGSFGAAHISDRIGIGTQSPTTELVVEAADSPEILLVKRGATGAHIRYQQDSGVLQIGGDSGLNTGIYFNLYNGSNYANAFVFGVDGTLNVTRDNAKISGSATSTGSFGSLILGSSHPRIHGNISIEGTLGVGTGQSTALHVSNTDPIFRLQNGGNYFDYAHTSGNDLELSYNGGSALIHLANSGQLGIGTNNPTSYDASADDLVIYRSSNSVGITLVTGDGTNYGILSFGDGTGASSYRGALSYLHSADSMQFQTAAAERMKIDSSGNVGIGTSSPTRKLHVDGDALVTGILTAQEFHTEFVSASVMFDSGSTKFGDDTADIHEMTGSLKISGSLGINLPLSASGPEASLDVGTLIEGGDGVKYGAVIRGQELPGTNLEQNDGIGLKFEIPIDTATSNIGASIEAKKSSNLDSNSQTQLEFRTSANDETLVTGFTIFSSQNSAIPATKGLYLDGGSHTYIAETSNDVVDVYTGGVNALKIASTEIQVPRYITHMGDGNNYIDFGTDTQVFVTDGGDTLQLLSNHDVIVKQGNLGIGTSSPAYHLHISASSGANAIQFIESNTADKFSYIGYKVSGTDYNVGVGGSTTIFPNKFYIYDNTAAELRATINSTTLELPTANYLISGSATSTGSFGSLQIGQGNHPYEAILGHNKPLIMVETTLGFGAGISVIQSTNDANGGTLALGKSRGLPGANSAVQSGDIIGRLAFSADDGTDLRSLASEIRSVVVGSVSSDTVPSDLLLMTNQGDSVNSTEVLRLTSDNKISGSSTSTGSFGSLDINMAGLGNSLGDKFRITAGSGGQPAAFYSSNQELKINFYTGDGSQAGNIDIYDAAGNVDTRLNGGGTSWFAGELGVGITSPDNTLHVHKGTAGTVAGNNSTTPLVVENNNHNFIQFLNPADKQAGLYFGSPSNNYYDGTIAYDKPNDQFAIEIDAASGNNKVIQIGTTYMSSSADVTGSFGQLVVGKGAPKTTGHDNALIVEGNISGSGRMIIADKGTSLAATIRATDTTNGYGLAVEGGGTGNTRYNVIFRSADASTVYGGIATKSGQVGYWGIGVSPGGTLANRLNVAGNASIGASYSTVTAPTSGLLVQGSVGIGNPNVPKQLTVSGSGTQEFLLESSDGHARATLDGETSSDLVFKDNTAGSGARFAQLRLSDELFRLRRLSDAGALVTNPGFVFDMQNDRFGIGIESPEGQFHVSGSEKTLIECNASSETLGIINTNASPYGIQLKFEGASPRNSSENAYVLRAIDSTGDFLHIKSNGTYSGSATATGSFGAMHVAQNTYDRVGFGTQVLDQAKVMIKQTQDNGTALHMDVTDTTAAGSTIMAKCIFSGDADATLAKFFSFNDSGAEIGSIEVSGTSTVAFNTSSDYRLKENIVLSSNGLKRLNLLKPRQFNFKKSDVTMDGFLAHELDEVLPYAVSGEKDALNEDGSIKAQQVDQSRIVPLLVRAVQELSAKVEELEKKLK